ncbi:MAG: phosphatidate cytidylyltransferase [Anaerolineae bacterium]|nr:MAG: phosphatidate cytidylyltransferase [Anaerolineae bacterium]
MLRHRVFSAIALIPVVAWVVYAGNWWFLGALAIAGTLAGREFYQMMHQGGFKAAPAIGLSLIVLLLLDAHNPSWGIARPAIALTMILSFVWHLLQKDDAVPTANWALTVVGGLYLGWFLGHFILLRARSDGLAWTIVAFLSTWVSDTGAYFVGLAIGRHKLWPRISPKKTWEGSIGGIIIGVLGTALVAWLAGLPVEHGVAIGALIPIITPFGDFAISMMKRQVDVKDSSSLIPGHGGMLDRLDSLLFSAVVVYYYTKWVVG